MSRRRRTGERPDSLREHLCAFCFAVSILCIILTRSLQSLTKYHRISNILCLYAPFFILFIFKASLTHISVAYELLAYSCLVYYFVDFYSASCSEMKERNFVTVR